MDRHENDQENRDDRERGPGEPPAPRGNPETDREVVERGEEQLEKISGN